MGQHLEGVASPVSTEEMIRGLISMYIHIVILLISKRACPLLPQTPGTPTPASGGLASHTTSALCLLRAPFHLGLTAQLKALWPHTNKTRPLQLWLILSIPL